MEIVNPQLLENIKLLQLRRLVVVGAAVWWVALALLSRMNLSLLQLEWTSEAAIAILIFIPACVLTGLFGLLFQDRNYSRSVAERRYGFLYSVFWFFMFLFAVQCAIFTPPALSGDPNEARLEWGFKYVHVITEIVVRTTVLFCIGSAVARCKFRGSDRFLLLVSLSYTLLVVSRSFMLEIVFYWAFSSYLISRNSGHKIAIRPKHVLLFVSIFLLFIVYGNWRQGSDFSIVEYGELLVDSNVLAWIFGYFLINYDNLALIIMDDFKNDGASNVFGSIMQTLQLSKFETVDDYLYVGKFNLGTAIRPFVLDFGPWAGGAIFAFAWMAVIFLPTLCRSRTGKYAAILLVAYMGFCLPITGRLEQPPYLFPLVWIVLIDRFVFVWSSSKSTRGNLVGVN